jgi:adenine deaminase
VAAVDAGVTWRRAVADVALGQSPAELVVRGGHIVNVHTAEVLDGDVAVRAGRVCAVGVLEAGAIGPDTVVIDAEGGYVVPGFIEPHMHAAEIAVAPADLAVALLERGTTTLATDLVEYYAVGGPEAVRWALDELEDNGLRVLFLLPVHALGMEQFGTVRHAATVDELLEMATWPQVAGVNEPPPNTVLHEDGAVLEILDAVLTGGRVFEGHGPGLGGARLQAYLATGASSDHESTTADEARAKLRLGSRVMMRECSAARNLRQLAPLIVERPALARFFMVCSDDLQCKELVTEGHVDHKLRVALECGVDPVTAIQLATINPAEYFGLANDLGAITPGSHADVLILDSLEEMRPHTVIASGRVIRQRGATLVAPHRSPPPPSLNATVAFPRPVTPQDVRHLAPADAPDVVTVRVIGIDNGRLTSEALTHRLGVDGGVVVADPGADVLKVVALDRHTASERVATAYVHGTGLRSGAIASTFTWPHYGLVAVGADDDDIAAALNALRDLGGGLVAVEHGRAIAHVEFDIGAITGSRPLEQMHHEITAFEDAAARLGCRLVDPVTALAALTIPHIPRYGLSDTGLYDGEAECFVATVVAGG